MSAPKVISDIFSESYDIQKDQEPLAKNAFEGAGTRESLVENSTLGKSFLGTILSFAQLVPRLLLAHRGSLGSWDDLQEVED